MNKANPLEKYRKPTNCSYPPVPNDYCWAFACHIDGKQGYEDIERICSWCEYRSGKSWNGGKGEMVE